MYFQRNTRLAKVVKKNKIRVKKRERKKKKRNEKEEKREYLFKKSVEEKQENEKNK